MAKKLGSAGMDIVFRVFKMTFSERRKSFLKSGLSTCYRPEQGSVCKSPCPNGLLASSFLDDHFETNKQTNISRFSSKTFIESI